MAKLRGNLGRRTGVTTTRRRPLDEQGESTNDATPTTIEAPNASSTIDALKSNMSAPSEMINVTDQKTALQTSIQHTAETGKLEGKHPLNNETKPAVGYKSEIKRPPIEADDISQMFNATETNSSSSISELTETTESLPHETEDSGKNSTLTGEGGNPAAPPFSPGLLPQLLNATNTTSAALVPEQIEAMDSSSNGTEPVDGENSTSAMLSKGGAAVLNMTSTISGKPPLGTNMTTSSALDMQKHELPMENLTGTSSLHDYTKNITSSLSGQSAAKNTTTITKSSLSDLNPSNTTPVVVEIVDIDTEPPLAEDPAPPKVSPAIATLEPTPSPTPTRPASTSSRPKGSIAPKTQSDVTAFTPDEKKRKPDDVGTSRAEDKLQRPTIEPRPEEETQFVPFSGESTSRGVSCSRPNGLLARASCQTASVIHGHPVSFSAVFVVVALLLGRLCRGVCCRKKQQDERGEYRTVAAQYGELLYDNTFDDNFSFAGSTGSMMSDEEDDWSQGVKIEMSGIRQERNGGLSLEEMNG